MAIVVTKGPWEPYGGYKCAECGGTVSEKAVLVGQGICPECGCKAKFDQQPIRARRRVITTRWWGIGRIESSWEYKGEEGGS